MSKKSHPLDSLTFSAPKLEEVTPEKAAARRGTVPQKDATRASNVTLPVSMWEWIDAKHAEARSRGGHPFRKTAIIRAVLDAVMAVEVDLSGAATEQEITERIVQAMKE